MNMRIRQSYRHVARGIALVCLASLAPACADASLPTALSPDPSSAQVVPAAIPDLEVVPPAAPEVVVVQPPPVPVPRVYGRADLDPDNDHIVAPPDTVPDCEQRLQAAGVKFRVATLPVKERRGYSCGTEQGYLYLSGPTELKIRPKPIVDCGMALALARFEHVVQAAAEAELGMRVRRMTHVGTYSCRKMAAYPDWVSEHSYANAIDVKDFTLANWQKVTIKRHFLERKTPAWARANQLAKSKFLQSLATQLYKEDVFSVVLTPHFDANHHDHFHLDLARYRADGT